MIQRKVNMKCIIIFCEGWKQMLELRPVTGTCHVCDLCLEMFCDLSEFQCHSPK